MKKYLKLLLKLSKYVLLLAFITCIGLFYIGSLKNTGVEQTAPARDVDTAQNDSKEAEKTLVQYLSDEFDSSRQAQAEDSVEETECRITILDVGQGLCCLIESNGEYMLFDGGDRNTSSYVVACLKERGIRHIKYLVASHYHADHIYGLVGAIESGITFDKLICPDYETSVYSKEVLLQRVDTEKIIEPYVSQTFSIGAISARCISPVTDAYSDDNGYSVGLVLSYKDLSVLIDGDATEESEKDMLDNGVDVGADILVVPHHGSTYSSSSDWLAGVNAKAAIISCGMGNDYFHPHSSTLQRLRESGIESLYRTDLQGDIVITYDDEHNTYRVDTQKACEAEKLWLSGDQINSDDTDISDIWNSDDTPESYYIGNLTSKRFHRPSCKQLPSEKKRIIFSTREDALSSSYVPCGMCNP